MIAGWCKKVDETMISDERGQNACNSVCTNLIPISKPYGEFELTYTALKSRLARAFSYRIVYKVPFIYSIVLKQEKRSSRPFIRHQMEDSSQNIKIGDLVEVLQESEIKKTLNRKNKLKGLGFMPEMEKWCGKRSRVLKVVSRIKIESTGELRILRNPLFLLEGVYCDGEFHENCERLCFLFWRSEWLRKV